MFLGLYLNFLKIICLPKFYISIQIGVEDKNAIVPLG